MAEAGTVGNPLIDAGTQVGTPVGTMGFGARESADETRQAQQSVSNDAPTDVNFNAIVARSQALTVDAIGKSFAANQDVREKLQDQFLARMGTKT
jgi:hypothetical protein